MKSIKIVSTLFTLLFLFSCVAETAIVKKEGMVNKITPSELHKQWVLFAIDEQPIDSKIKSTLTLSPSNKATGKLACNNFVGALNQEKDKLKIERLAGTKQLCPNNIMNVEKIVSTVLRNWSEIKLDDEQLTLVGKSHQLNYKRK